MKPGIVVTFDNFYPPLQEHIDLIDSVIMESKEYKYDYRIYALNNTNFPYENKVYWINESYGKDIVTKTSITDVGRILKRLNEDYKSIIIIADKKYEYICEEYNESFDNFKFVPKVLPRLNKNDIIKVFNENKSINLSNRLSEETKSLLMTEIFKSYDLYERVIWDPMKGSEFIYNTGKSIYDAGKSVVNTVADVSTDVGRFAYKSYDLIKDILVTGFGKHPIVSSVVFLLLVGRYLKKKSNQNYDPKFSDAPMRKMYGKLEEDEYSYYSRLHTTKYAEKVAADLYSHGITPKEYYKKLEDLSSDEIEHMGVRVVGIRKIRESVEYLDENLSVKTLDHTIRNISKTPGISFDDKSKLINALVAIRSQQYGAAEKILAGVNDVVKIQITSQLRNNDPEDILKGLSDRYEKTSDVKNYASRKILPVGIGSTLGYAAGELTGINPYVTAALGGIAGASVKNNSNNLSKRVIPTALGATLGYAASQLVPRN